MADPTLFRDENGAIHLRRLDVPLILAGTPFRDDRMSFAQALARAVSGPVDPNKVRFLPEHGFAVVGPRIRRDRFQNVPDVPSETYLVVNSKLGTDWLMQFGPCGVFGLTEGLRMERLGLGEEIVGLWDEARRRHVVVTGETIIDLAWRLTGDMIRARMIHEALTRKRAV